MRFCGPRGFCSCVPRRHVVCWRCGLARRAGRRSFSCCRRPARGRLERGRRPDGDRRRGRAFELCGASSTCGEGLQRGRRAVWRASDNPRIILIIRGWRASGDRRYGRRRAGDRQDSSRISAGLRFGRARAGGSRSPAGWRGRGRAVEVTGEGWRAGGELARRGRRPGGLHRDEGGGGIHRVDGVHRTDGVHLAGEVGGRHPDGGGAGRRPPPPWAGGPRRARAGARAAWPDGGHVRATAAPTTRPQTCVNVNIHPFYGWGGTPYGRTTDKEGHGGARVSGARLSTSGDPCAVRGVL